MKKINAFEWSGQNLVTALAAMLILLLLILKFLALPKEHDLSTLGVILFYILLFFAFVFRNSTQSPTSQSSKHWFFALSGTLLPLALAHQKTFFFSNVIGLTLELIGMTLSIISLSYLGRSFGMVAANRTIKTNGVYRYIRHPLYTGEAIWFFSLILQNLGEFNIILFCVQITCQYIRILEEEDLLKQDETYLSYMKQVPWRIIPGLF